MNPCTPPAVELECSALDTFERWCNIEQECFFEEYNLPIGNYEWWITMIQLALGAAGSCRWIPLHCNGEACRMRRDWRTATCQLDLEQKEYTS